MTTQLVPPEDLLRHIGSETPTDYVSIAEHFFDIFQQYGGIKPTDKILDIGCGCGRMAIPLTQFLTSGSYEGFDILPELITWCKQNIETRFPAFHFQLAEVQHDLYSKDAKVSAKDFRFPFADNHFDFTFLTSVFTHLLQDDLEHYTREIKRTLRPGGTALITFFLLNEDSERLSQTPDAKIQIIHDFGQNGAKVMDLQHPEAAIGFPEPYVRQLLADSGLVLQEPIHFGSWCGRQGTVSFQDVLVCHK